MNQSYWLKVLGVILLAFIIAGGYLYLKDNNLFKQPVVEPKSQLGAAAGVVEAILGNNVIGTQTDDSNRNALSAFPFTMTEDGTAISMSVYIAKAEAGSQYSLAIYADNAGNPGDLVASGPNQSVSSTGWYTLPIAANLKANTTYWLTFNTTANISGNNVLSYTTGSGAYKWHFQTFGTWPTNFGAVNGMANNLVPSLYLTYTKPAPATVTTGGTPSTVFNIGATIVVSQGPVNIRSNPSLTASIVGTANTNDQGVILDGPNYNEGFNWWKVSYKNGTLIGWTTGAYQYTLVGGTTAPVTTAFDFALSYLTSQSIAQGQTTSAQVITVTKNAGTAEAVNLSISGLPTGATASFNPTNCTPNTTCTSNLTVTAGATTPAGTYKLTVTGQTGAGLVRTSAFDLTVTATTVTATTTTPIATPVTNGKFAIGDGVKVTRGPLNVRDIPSLRKPAKVLGTQATNAPGVVVDGPQTADRYTWWKINYATGADGWSTENYLVKTTSATTPVDTTPVSTTTVPVASVLSFTTTAQGPVTVAQGTVVSTNVTVNFTQSNSAQTVTLSTANLPTGVTGTFNPTTCTSLATGASTCSVALGLAALGSAPVGTYNFTINAVGGGQTASANVSLTISAAAPLSTTFSAGDQVEVTPGVTTLNVRSGPGTSYSILGTKTSGDTGTVQSDSLSGLSADSYNWWKIDFGGLVGWAADAFLRLFQPTPVASTSSLAKPSLGINLEQMTDWQRAYMFVDTIKTARGFWDATGGYTAAGWPIGDFNVIVIKDSNRRCLSYDANWNCLNEVKDSNDPDISGTYSLSFTGKANVSASALKSSASVQNLVYANGVTTAQVVVGAGAIDLRLYFSGTNGLPITNIKLYRPGYPLTTSQVFTNEFLESIKPFSTIRLMDFQATNWFSNQTARKKIVNWSDRPGKNDPIQDFQEDKGIEIGNGVAVEWAVDLANTTGKDLWINIPHTASADYVTGLANYLKTNLNSNSKVYLEFSNEVWNAIFKQDEDIRNEAIAYVNSGQTPRLDTNQSDINNDLYWTRHLTIKKLADISNIFRSVFGDAAMMTRIRPIFADQSARYSAAASALAWLSRSYPNPVNYYIYGVANAPYYGATNADTGSVDSILTGSGSVEDGINNRMGGDILADASRHSYFYTLAQTYGIKNVTYEGGTDLGQGSTNIANKVAASYDPRMENITKGYLAQWYACGDGDLFMYFDQSNVYSTSGQWGLTDDVRRDYNNPSAMAAKMKGARYIASADPRTFECASIGNGFYDINTAGVLGTGTGLLGTYYSDQNFGTVKVSRVDPIINFIWGNYGTGSPFPTTRNDGRAADFSVKWSGQVMPKFSATYTFTLETDTDDVATLSVNGQSLGSSGNVTLTAGQKYPIQISLKPGANGSGKARLWWSTTNGQQIKAIVPKSQLFSN